MTKERHSRIVAVYAIIENSDGLILAGMRQNTGYMDGRLQVPSGHCEHGESLKEALQRELCEEINISINLEALTFVGLYDNRNLEGPTERNGVFFRVTLDQNQYALIKNMEPEKCRELLWVPKDHENLVPTTQMMLKTLKNGGNFIEI